MEYQFKTSCNHHGTIKPVASTTGKHAGKWMCKIKGDNIGSQHTNVKTIFTAPFLGAAKAAIAKYLGIVVPEIKTEATHQSTPGKSAASTPIAKQTTQTKSNQSMTEFDDDDDAFASFDLNAAVSSAKKLAPGNSASNPYTSPPNQSVAFSTKINPAGSSLPPQYPNSTYRSVDSATNFLHLKAVDELKKELEKLRSEKDLLEKEVRLAKEEAEKLGKEVSTNRQEVECLRKESANVKREYDGLKGRTRAVREEYDKLRDDLKLATQNNENMVEEGKRQTKARIEANEALESERNKLKGSIRALQEQHSQLIDDVKSASQKKNDAEEEVSAALQKKEKYEQEASATKIELEARRGDLGGLAQHNSTAVVACKVEPPTKKRKTVKDAKSGVIVKTMKVAELKEEAAARGIDAKSLVGVNKDRLLNLLVVGSACITKTDAWSEILRVREKFAEDRRQVELLERQRKEELDRKAEQEWREQQQKEKLRKEKLRAEEISKQREMHSLEAPKVHCCKLAESQNLLFHGSQRRYNASCSECGYMDVLYTCEKCDFDICRNCYKEKTMTPEEKKAEAIRRAKLEEERRKQEARRRKLEEQEEARHRKKWDHKSQFRKKIFQPPKTNLDPDGNKKKGFTVWCSDGYGYDGWHSYEGPPEKEFDSTYATKEEANERARYLFFWKNPWGHEAESIESEAFNKSLKDGMVTYEVTPDGSSTWTVSVVPDAAYAYLENATLRRHRSDSECSDDSNTPCVYL